MAWSGSRGSLEKCIAVRRMRSLISLSKLTCEFSDLNKQIRYDMIANTMISDAATPLEQLHQILAIQPVLPGSQTVKRYDIPPHHPHGQSDLLVDTASGLDNMKGLKASLPPTAAGKSETVSLLD